MGEKKQQEGQGRLQRDGRDNERSVEEQFKVGDPGLHSQSFEHF